MQYEHVFPINRAFQMGLDVACRHCLFVQLPIRPRLSHKRVDSRSPMAASAYRAELSESDAMNALKPVVISVLVASADGMDAATFAKHYEYARWRRPRWAGGFCPRF